MTNHLIPDASERALPPLPEPKHIADGRYGYTAMHMAEYVRADRAAAQVGAKGADVPAWRDVAKTKVKVIQLMDYENRLLLADKEIADLRARLATGAPAETPKPAQRYELVEKQRGTGHMVYWEKEMEPDESGEWVKFTDIATPAATIGAGEGKDVARYKWLRSIGHEQLNVMAHYAGPQMDAAIDAAMRSKTSPGEAR